MTPEIEFLLATDSVQNLAVDLLIVGMTRVQGESSDSASAGKSASRGGRKTRRKGSEVAASDVRSQLAEQLGAIDEALGGGLAEAAANEGFRGDAGQTFALHTLGQMSARCVVLMGLGKEDELTIDDLRKLGGRCAREAGARKAGRIAASWPELEHLHPESAVRAVIEGSLLGRYRFDRYLTKNKDDHPLTQVALVASVKKSQFKGALSHARAVSAGVCLARDLVNECASALTPEQFAKEARQVAKAVDLEVEVFTEKELSREKMGLLMAVAKAALPYTPPRMVRLHYKPTGKARKKIALVGKGLTFDSGGLDLKPAAGMLEMKIDMSGAAAVLGAMRAIGELRPDVEVVGYLGCVENGIGGNAYHPGDVLTSRKGLTVEINNTDAEGRLVLADVIDYALGEDKPDVLVDLATLTGACMVALGPTTAGLFSTDDELAEDIRSAGRRAGEDFWRLPLNQDLMGQLKSPIADLRNTGDRHGGAITAALFLEQFVDKRARWAHLDIAGPATFDKDSDYHTKGGAGFGVRTLVGLIVPG